MARKAAARQEAARPSPPEPDPLAEAAAHLAEGQPRLAIDRLLPALDRRAADGDRACALAAAAFRLAPMAEVPLPPPPDTLAVAVGRLVALVRQQEEQIRTLRGLLEEEL